MRIGFGISLPGPFWLSFSRSLRRRPKVVCPECQRRIRNRTRLTSVEFKSKGFDS